MKTSLSKKEIYLSIVIVSLFCACVEKIAFPNEIFNFLRFFLMICSFVILICCINFLANFKFEKKISNFYKKNDINKTFVIFTFVIGVFSSFLIPFNEIPDEVTHINYIYDERGLNLEYSDINSDYFGTPDVMENNSNKINYSQYFDLSKKINTNFKVGIPKVTIVRHFPQMIATAIGEIFHLPMVIYLALAELFALVFYIYICNKAISLMPFKKNVLMFIMLLPVCIQQMASFSYDVVLNSFCFLYFATVFYLKFKKEKIKGFDLLKLLSYVLIISICKIPYGILGLLLLILPLDKIEITCFHMSIDFEKLKKVFVKHKVIYCFTLSIVILLSLFFVYNVLISISIGRILISSFINFWSTLSLMGRSIHIFLSYYFQSIVGNLGIFNIKTPLFFEIFIYFSLLFITFSCCLYPKNKNNKIKFSKFDLFIIYFLIIIMIYIIILSMFEWTLYIAGVSNYNNLSMSDIKNYIQVLPFIGGVQGRYFLPIIPLICFTCNSEKLSNIVSKLSPYSYQFIYYVSLAIYFILTMIIRFWI